MKLENLGNKQRTFWPEKKEAQSLFIYTFHQFGARKPIQHTTSQFYRKKNKTDNEIWTKTWSEELKPVALEKYELEKRQLLIIIPIF